MAKRVLVAMSGGVDSSTVAALLVREGYDVIGVTMQIWPASQNGSSDFGGCCSLEAIEDARRVAFKLGIAHYVLNFRDVFSDKVISDFTREYLRGRTPNPCLRCNQHVKFEKLLTKLDELEADFLATGHYARIEWQGPSSGAAEGTVGDRYCLRKGVDSEKDQSYFLGTMPRSSLRRVLFPLGDYHKHEVRSLARQWGLAVADKAESQEICFIPDDDYGRYLKESCPQLLQPGPIRTSMGEVIGRHEGIAFYTIGQRKGLGVATGRRLYVQALDTERNEVIIGPEDELYSPGLMASQVNWLDASRPKAPLPLMAKIRYRTPEAPAVATLLPGNRVAVMFDEAQRAITPGQGVVFYVGDQVIGGGMIESKLQASQAELEINEGQVSLHGCEN